MFIMHQIESTQVEPLNQCVLFYKAFNCFHEYPPRKDIGLSSRSDWKSLMNILYVVVCLYPVIQDSLQSIRFGIGMNGDVICFSLA